MEVRGPIVRPIDFKKPLSAVLKRSAPKLKFFGGFYNPNHDYTDVYEQNRDERYQNEARMPDSIEVFHLIHCRFETYVLILHAPEGYF